MVFKNIVVGLIFFILSLFFSLYAQDTWDLKKCLDVAKENNIELKNLKLGINKTEINYTRAKQNVYPDLDANIKTGNYYGLLKDKVTDNYYLGNTYINNFQLASSFNLFSGFYNRYRIRYREGQINSASYLFDKRLNEITLEITYYYYQVLLHQEMGVLIKKRIETLKQRKKFIEANVNAEILHKRNIYNIDFLIAKGETDLLNSENTAQQNVVNLMSLLGSSNKEQIRFSNPSDVSLTEIRLYNYNTIIEQARNNFPDIKMGASEIKNAEFAHKQFNSFRYPSLTMEGLVNIVTYDKVNSFSKNFYKKNYQYLGFNLSIPIYKNYNIKQDIALAAIDIEIAKNNSENLLLELENNVYKAVLEYNNAYNLYLSLQKQFEAVNEEYNFASKLFEVGNLGVFEFTDISERFIDAETDLLEAKYDLLIKMKVVDFYVGYGTVN